MDKKYIIWGVEDFGLVDDSEIPDCPGCDGKVFAISYWMDDDTMWHGWACNTCEVNYELDLMPIPNE